jgi:hypothetical protein
VTSTAPYISNALCHKMTMCTICIVCNGPLQVLVVMIHWPGNLCQSFDIGSTLVLGVFSSTLRVLSKFRAALTHSARTTPV